MNQEEKEERAKNHKNYWDTVDKIRDVSLKALDDLCVSDVLSALDRIKTELLQQDVLVMMKETMENGEEGEESEEAEELEKFQQGIKNAQVSFPLLNIADLELLNRYN